jgi:hypothetical protein
MDSALSTADGGIGMTAGSVQNMRNGLGDARRVFAGRRETVGSINIKGIAVPVVAYSAIWD